MPVLIKDKLFLIILIIEFIFLNAPAMAQTGSFGLPSEYFLESSQKVLNNLRTLYKDQIKDNFNNELEFQIIPNFIPGLNGTFPDLEEVMEKSKVIIEIHIGGDRIDLERRLSLIHILQVACHELGHGLGSIKRNQSPVIATEAESDYFVPSCMKNYFKNYQLPLESVSSLIFDPDTIQVCGTYGGFHCLEILQSSKDIFSQFVGGPLPSYLRISEHTHQNKESSYPDDQCRLDIIRSSLIESQHPECF